MGIKTAKILCWLCCGFMILSTIVLCIVATSFSLSELIIIAISIILFAIGYVIFGNIAGIE